MISLRNSIALEIGFTVACGSSSPGGGDRDPGAVGGSTVVERALVRGTEAIIESEISASPFQTDTTLQDRHYQAGRGYMAAGSVVQALMERVSRYGSLLLDVTQHGRGDLAVDAMVVHRAGQAGRYRDEDRVEAVHGFDGRRSLGGL